MAKLEELLGRLSELALVPLSELESDPRLEASAERWLQVAAECTIDLANHLIADRGWSSPGSYREAFEILQQQGVLEKPLAKQMVGWAGLRNVLVHLYVDVRLERLHETLREELDQLRDFATALHVFTALDDTEND